MRSLRSLLTTGIMALTVCALSPTLHASMTMECGNLFEPVKNVGAKTELQSQLQMIKRRLAANGLDIGELTLSVRAGDRARVYIALGDTEVAYGTLRPSAQSVHVGRVSIETIRVAFRYTKLGIGRLTYLLLAREAIRRGFVLESGWDLTDEDRAMWSRLTSHGWAKKVDYLFTEFDPDFISSAATIETIDQFTATFNKPGSPSDRR
jgi:hypothetical protein